MTETASIQQQDRTDETDTTLTPIKIYVNNELIPLTTLQTRKIMEIIQTNACADLDTSQAVKIEKDMDLHNEDKLPSEYIFDANDSFLNSMFAEPTAMKIKHVVGHKLLPVFIVTTGLIAFALGRIFGDNSTVFNVYTIGFYCLVCIPWLIFQHLLFNKFAFRLCVQTFDYWIKVGYGIVFSFTFFIHGTLPMNGFTLPDMRECLVLAFMLLGLSYVSSFDAINSTKISRLIVTIVAALIITFYAISSQFLWADQDDYQMVIPLANGRVNSISIQSLFASSCRIIAIFFWKQFIVTWFSKGKAITIYNSPKITWVDSSICNYLEDVITANT